MSSVGHRDAGAIILAAGIGRRLGDSHDGPKVLLSFDGKTLLQRHLEALGEAGVGDVSITLGHRGAEIRAEVERLGQAGRVNFVENPRYTEGSLVSLWTQGELMRSGRPVLLMDGDVLYDSRMIDRLFEGAAENALLVDREIEPGDEPVKICFRGETIVDFRKKPEHAHDWHGESVGFFHFSPATAAALWDRCDDYVARGVLKVEYEEAIRDLMLAEPARFGAVDVSDLPWTEIDFEADVERARHTILPQLANR